MRSSVRALRLLLPGLLGLGLFALVGASPAGAVPSPTFTCTGTISGLDVQVVPSGTYRSLVMPSGSFCAVVDAVTVQSPMTLGAGSALLVVEGTPPGYTAPAAGALTVQGPVTVGTEADFSVATYTPDFVVTPVTVNGPVSVGANALLGLVASTVGGSLRATNPSAIDLYFSHVGGGVTIAGGGGTNAPTAAFIAAGVAGPEYQYIDVEGTTISGPLSITSYDGNGVTVFYENTIGGPFTFSNNTEGSGPYAGYYPDAYLIGGGGSVIMGPATCSGNTPAPNTGFDYAFTKASVGGPVRGTQALTCVGVGS